jgi:hypothetical protein
VIGVILFTISGLVNNVNIPNVNAEPNGKDIFVDSSTLSYKSADQVSFNSNEYSAYSDYGTSDGYDTRSSDYSYPKEKKIVAELEEFDNELFVCDNGIVVDDRINCPQKCPFNTPLEGVYVTDLDVCLTQPGVGVTCPLDTDLPGVVVTDEAIVTYLQNVMHHRLHLVNH